MHTSLRQRACTRQSSAPRLRHQQHVRRDSSRAAQSRSPRLAVHAAADLRAEQELQADATTSGSSSSSSSSSCPFLAVTSGPMTDARREGGGAAAHPTADGGAPAALASSHQAAAASADDTISSSVAGLAGPNGCWRVLGPPPHAAAAATHAQASSNGQRQQQQQQQQQRQLPQPQGRWCFNPVLGEYGELEAKGAGAFCLERFREFGPIFSWRLGGRKVVTLLDYEAVSSLLRLGDSKVMVAWNPEAMYAMLGESTRRSLEEPAVRLLTRKLLAPGFSREALRGYLGKLVDICHSQLEAWAMTHAPVNLTHEGKALSFEFSTQLLVELDIPAEQKAGLRDKFAALFQGMLAPPIRLPGTRFSKGLAARAALLEDLAAIMRQRQGAPRKDSVLDYSLSAKRQAQGSDLNEQQAAEAAVGLIIAGNDTSGLGVTALLAVLPQFPAVMQRLREEQQQLIAQHGPEITVSLLDQMPFCEAVVKEVLRLAPPSAQILRRTLVDLEICGKYVPAGTILQLSSFFGQVMTDPRVGPADSLAAAGAADAQTLQALHDNWGAVTAASLAHDFRPERWLAPPPGVLRNAGDAGDAGAAAGAAAAHANGSSSSGSSSGGGGGDSGADGGLSRPSALLTFSQGPHACLGVSLFMSEAKVLLSLIARGYDITPEAPNDLSFDTSFVTQLKKGEVRVRRLEAPLPYTAQDRSHASSSSSSRSEAASGAVPVAR